MNERTRTSRSMSLALRIVFLFLFVAGFAACSGDTIVNVPAEVDPRQENPTIPFVRLGADDTAGEGIQYILEDSRFIINDEVWLRSMRATGSVSQLLFFASEFQPRSSQNPVNTLFIISGEPFEGAVQAGRFSERELRFATEDFDVLITTEASSILGDGSSRDAWVRVEEYEGESVVGSAHDLDLVLDPEAATAAWAFKLENGKIEINGEVIVDGGFSLQAQSLDFFYLFTAETGIFIVADDPFDEAEEAGAFEGKALNFSIGGFDVRVGSKAPALLEDGTRKPAWVLHEPDFVIRRPNGLDGIERWVIGVSSDLEHILSRDQSGGIASN